MTNRYGDEDEDLHNRTKSTRAVLLLAQVMFIAAMVFSFFSFAAKGDVNTEAPTTSTIDTDKSSLENQQELKDGNQQSLDESNNQQYSLDSNEPTSGTAGHTWQYYGSSKGSSKTEQNLSNEVVSDALFLLTEGGSKVLNFAYGHSELASFFLGKLGGKIESATQGSTYYWWVSTWKDKDATSVYVRHHVKIYSNAARTNKTADYWDYQTY